MPQPYSNVIAYTHIATDDDQFRLVNTDMWVSNANIHVVTNSALYGKVNNQPATSNPSDILIFDNFNLADLWFRNAGAGSNTTIYMVGITMSKAKILELGL
jgi:hypothetical protein